MRRSVAVLVLSLAASLSAIAGEPGQPLDCSDMQFLLPGLTCRTYAPFATPDGRLVCNGIGLAVDNEGYFYIGENLPEAGAEIRRTNDGGQTQTVVLRITPRPNSPSYDYIRLPDYRECGNPYDVHRLRITFDPVHGVLYVPFYSYCGWTSCLGPQYQGLWIAAIEGFTTLFDVLESYTPTGESLGFRVPQRPEGLRAADRFDTYTGEVTRPLDLSQAQPLQCSYPAAPPSAGDYLTFPASGTPTPGHALYYLTSVTYQGQTRAGRQALDGTLHGRDASRLPACTLDNQAVR